MYRDKYSPPDILREFGKPVLSTQEQVLAHALLKDDKTATVSYLENERGQRMTLKFLPENWQALITKFKTNPKETLAMGRYNLYAILQDPKVFSRDERNERLGRYLEAFNGLQVKIDRSAYPPNPDTIQEGVPPYVMDGLSDLGQDKDPDPNNRSREKIRVDKERILKEAATMTTAIYKHLADNKIDQQSDEGKGYILEQVLRYVHDLMPYDHDGKITRQIKGGSILLHDVIKERMAVCRHHALVTQVLLQSFGLTSRLLKCMYGAYIPEPHAANLVRINNVWHLVDATNPNSDENGRTTPFIEPLSEKTIDTNTHNYVWTPEATMYGKKQTRSYQSRHNMYYRIVRDR